MAKVTSFYVEYSRTVDLGNYNSAKARLGVEVELDESDNLHDVLKSTWEMVTNNITYKLQPIIDSSRGRPVVDVNEYYLGLPVEDAENADD